MTTSETPAGDTGFRDLRAADPAGRPGPAIVTGSESGIGRASAVELARRGHDVGITWFRDEAAGRATAE